VRFFLIFLPFFLFASVSDFIKDGYIIDPYNNNRVTTEAQGYGLLYALQTDNKRLFDKLYNWTKTHLKNKEGLFSWVYNKGKVLDTNNATDADLFITFALFRAYDKWKDKRYLEEAKKLIKNIKKLIVPVCWNSVDFLLIPGERGFIKNDKVTIFTSYYIPFIFRYFYKKTHNPLWKEILDYGYSFSKTTISDTFTYSLFEKVFYMGNEVSMDGYRVIIYAYMDNPKNVGLYKNSFKEIDEFFQKNGYIPLKYYFGKKKQMKKESPYCVYKWFYLLYNDKKYLKKYEELKEIDKKNYFCSFLDEISKKGW
jgi:endoglucanase